MKIAKTGPVLAKPLISIHTYNEEEEPLQTALQEVNLDETPIVEEDKPDILVQVRTENSSDNEGEDPVNQQIRNRPIQLLIPLQQVLARIAMATTTTTHITTIPKMTSKSTTTSLSTDITTKFQKGMKQTGPSGGGAPGGGTPGGSGGPPGGGIPGGIPAAPLAQQPIASAQGVKAIGALPQTFDRDRTKAEDFIEEVKSYFHINYDIAGFNLPMKQMAFTLTLIKGPDVARWTRNMGEVLDALDPLVDNIPAVWDQFLYEFSTQFQDSQKEGRAWQKLENLQIKFPDINGYISQFEELARQANYTQGNNETIQFFIRGLSRPILEDVMKAPFPHTYQKYKERAIDSTKSRQIIEALTGGWTEPPQRTNPFNNFHFQQHTNLQQSFFQNQQNNEQWRNTQPS